MTSDARDATSADLDIQFPAPRADALATTLRALRAFRLVGLVVADDEARRGSVTATVAYVAGRGLLVEAHGGVATTPAQPVVDALAARLGADVLLVLDEGADDFHAEAPFDVADAVDSELDEAGLITAPDDDIQVFVVGGSIALAPDRRAEMALQLASSFVAVPDGIRTLVVPTRPLDMPYWGPAERPVIALRLSAVQLSVQVYSGSAVRTGSRRNRLTARLVADWIGLWDPEPVDISSSEAGEAADVQQRLRDERLTTLAELALVDVDVLTETGIDGPALARLITEPLTDSLLDDVIAALRVPPTAAELLRGSRAAKDMPGAIVVERRSVGGTIADGLLAEPEGASLWTRWRRLPHRHPALAVALIVAELGVAAAAVWGARHPGTESPWTFLLWVAAAVCAIDALGDAILLAAIRRRRRSP